MTDSTAGQNRFLLAFVLGGMHTALFLTVALLVSISDDPEAGMAYYLFVYLDYPLSRLLQFGSSLTVVAVGGGILWFGYGFALQALISIRRVRDVVPLLISMTCIAILFALPELKLQSLPPWEEHWERGTEARESQDIDLAIRHVSEAVRLAPAGMQGHYRMWDYLGRPYMEKEDFPRAEEAFLAALSAARRKPGSRPIDVLDAHNELSRFYQQAGNTDKEKEHLRKAIEYNRIMFEGDSTREASCWERLADIAFEAGDTDEAIRTLKKAVAMEEKVSRPEDWSLGYMREKLERWSAKEQKTTEPTVPVPAEKPIRP